MRWFVLVLLILNVLYLGWEIDRDTKMTFSSHSPALKAPPGTRQLQKLDELTEEPELRSNASRIEFDQSLLPDEVENELIAELDERNISAEDLVTQLPGLDIHQPAGQPGEVSCFSFGPIPDQANALALNDWFASRGVGVRLTDKISDTKKIFWIYLAPQDGRTRAMQVIRDLKDRGIKDYRLINKGELNNAISLGLFSSQLRVNQRLRELRSEGYKPVVVPYNDVHQVYTVAVRLQVGSEIINQVFTGFPSGFNSTPVDCADS